MGGCSADSDAGDGVAAALDGMAGVTVLSPRAARSLAISSAKITLATSIICSMRRHEKFFCRSFLRRIQYIPSHSAGFVLRAVKSMCFSNILNFLTYSKSSRYSRNSGSRSKASTKIYLRSSMFFSATYFFTASSMGLPHVGFIKLT